MKVLHIINSLSAGGAELHLLTLCRYLKRAGMEVPVTYLKRARGSRFLGSDFQQMGFRSLTWGLRGFGMGAYGSGCITYLSGKNQIFFTPTCPRQTCLASWLA
jgi:hypothetical protein